MTFKEKLADRFILFLFFPCFLYGISLFPFNVLFLDLTICLQSQHLLHVLPIGFRYTNHPSALITLTVQVSYRL